MDDDFDDIYDFDVVLERFRKFKRQRRFKFVDDRTFCLHDDTGVQNCEYYVNQCNYGVDSHKGKQHSHQYNIKKR
jgi:hypothetical protein